jgi:hypothetical protein
MRRLIIGLVLVVAACGPGQAQATASPSAAAPTPTAAASPSSRPSPTTPGPLLFGVLEAKISGSPYTQNTVAIAGLDGYARTKTTFIPMRVPDVGCMGAVLPESAHVAAGRVYFADGKGVVRSLSTTGQVTTVATFPLTSSQQMLSFAVSPDGSRLLGSVLTASAKYFSCSGSQPAHSLTLDVFSAQAGGASALLYHQSLSDASKVMALTGWDAVGPLGTYPTVWASQGGGPGSNLGVAVRIDAGTGKVLSQVADPNLCLVWDTVASGDFICIPAGNASVSVRRPDGSEIWHFKGTLPEGFYFLAPDERHVVAGDETGLEVLGQDGTRVKLGDGIDPDGWLDSTTVIGTANASPQPNFAYVGVSAPGTVVSLGFRGVFVGTVHT